jgi:hypothetical protein
MLSFLLLNGCTGMKIEDFDNTQPSFILEDYFKGKTKAVGIFEDRFGKLRRQFTVDIAGTWDGRNLVLDERFLYDDGERDQRIWTIEKISDGVYRGRADDVLGVARGISRGNALNWRYDMNLKVGNNSYKVHFNDWMFLQSSGVMLNRARVSKFGIEIGTVTLAFTKTEKSEKQTSAIVSEWPIVGVKRIAANQ